LVEGFETRSWCFDRSRTLQGGRRTAANRRSLRCQGCGTIFITKVPPPRIEMTQIQHISIFAPLAVGLLALVCTIIIHMLPVRATINLVRREKSFGHVGMPWTDLGIFAQVVFYASLAHLIEIALWGVLFMTCGEFTDFGTAFYHSAVNYTSLG